MKFSFQFNDQKFDLSGCLPVVLLVLFFLSPVVIGCVLVTGIMMGIAIVRILTMAAGVALIITPWAILHLITKHSEP